MVGGSCEDDGSVVEVGMLEMDASVSPIVGSVRGGASDGIGMACLGVDRIPR